MTVVFDNSSPGDVADILWSNGMADNVGLIEHGTGRTYRCHELRSAAERVAAELRSLGLRSCEPVAVVGDNGAEFMAAYHGTLLAGGVAQPLDPHGTKAEWRSQLENSGALVALSTTSTRQRFTETPVAHVVAVGDGGDLGWDELLEGGTVHFGSPLVRERPAVLLSTGDPASGYSLLTQHTVVTTATRTARLHGLTAHDVVLCTTPFWDSYGMCVVMNPAMRAGSTLVTMPNRFSATDLLRAVELHRITVAYLAPPLLVDLVREAGTGHHDTSSLRLVCSRGEVPREVAETCSARFGVPVVER
ncbi:AMP-binding protein [Actinophytocola oryzae]|uniref:AMP-binding enzyme n=1 Tax=Actinophytocola oryzae TaxID=502181 RepID=A0A4R7VH36_9PSEU|nr:AMP-binding protein [Actinophytocola oryzae]TDV48646.1 AMP-binding enzyme [Actinophytocola oryzae]